MEVYMNLSFAPYGVALVITAVRAEEKLAKHLGNLGFLPGAEVTSLYDNKGDVIIRLGNTKLALGKGVAMKIEVTTKEDVCKRH